MRIRVNTDPIPQGTGFPSQQGPSQGYLRELPKIIGTILFYPDSESPQFIGVNPNPNANPNDLNWKIYTVTYNPTNPGFYTSIVTTTGAWNSLPGIT